MKKFNLFEWWLRLFGVLAAFQALWAFERGIGDFNNQLLLLVAVGALALNPYSRSWLPRLFGAAAILGALWLLDRVLGSRLNAYSYEQFVLMGAVAAIAAASLNLVNGITGQFSLGHAGFMAVGGYTAAYFSKVIGPRLILTDPALLVVSLSLGALAAGLVGLLVGLPSLRLRGDYLAIVTLGFNQIIVSIIQNTPAIGGATGFRDIPKLANGLWIGAALVLCLVCLRNLGDSNLGRAMRAVREDEIAAEAVGINTTQVKVLAFVIAAMWAGVAGGLQAHLLRNLNPDSFQFDKSIELVVMVVVGGLGSLTGSVGAAFALTTLTGVLRTVSGASWVMAGLLLAILILTFPRFLAQMRSPLGVVRWLAGPIVGAILLFVTLRFGTALLAKNINALRFVLYALILITMMLLRPQGLLGRWELSFRRKTSMKPVPLLALLPLFLLGGCQNSQTAAPTDTATGANAPKSSLKVALITPGDINDGGWNQLAYEGLQGVKDKLGADVANQVTKGSSDFQPAIRGFAEDGKNLIFCHGFEFGAPVKAVAPKFPDTKFVVVAGDVKQAPNVATLVPKLEEGTYLLGVVAGKMTKTNTLGCIGGMDLSVIRSTFAAFEAGAKSVNPKVKVITKFVGNFEDQNLGKAHAQTLISQGADILFHNADQAGNGMFVAAQEASKSGKKVWVFGSNRNQNAAAPDVCLGSAVIEMPHAFEMVAQSAEKGTFKPDFVELNLKNDTIGVEWNDALKSQIPAPVLKQVDAAEAAIKSGKLKIERKV